MFIAFVRKRGRGRLNKSIALGVQLPELHSERIGVIAVPTRPRRTVKSILNNVRNDVVQTILEGDWHYIFLTITSLIYRYKRRVDTRRLNVYIFSEQSLIH